MRNLSRIVKRRYAAIATAAKYLSWLFLSCALTPVQGATAIQWALEQPDQEAELGVTIGFNATIRNIGTTDVYLNSTTVVQDGDWTGVNLDDTAFFTLIPYPLPVGNQWFGKVFDISVGAFAAEGIYTGEFYVYGGADENADNFLAAQSFSIDVRIIPEPATWMYLAPATTFFLLRFRRRS